MDFFVKKRADQILTSIQLFKKETQHFRPFLVNVKLDCCDYFKTKRVENIIVRRVANYFLPYSNMNHTCPYEGQITFKEFNFEPYFMPSIWPSGLYKAIFTFYFNNDSKPAIKVEAFFELKEKNKLRFK